MRVVVRLLALAITLTLAAGASVAGASTIVFQCGAAVCAVDPDGSAGPRQLTPQGRLAGITRDGATASWFDSDTVRGTIVQAPVAGGAPQAVPYDGEVHNQLSMSPDGTRYLWWYVGPDGFGGLNAVWVNRLTVGQPSVEGVSFCSFCTTTHGWLGASTAIAAFPRTENGAPSKVCRLASSAEEPGKTGSCVQQLLTDERGGIGFPSSNAAGTEIVAVLSPGERTGTKGRIVRYALPAGTPTDVTAGTTDTTPAFSAEGDRVAFERDGRIVVRDLASGAERAIADGTSPSWGGARAVTPPPDLTKPASVRVASSVRAATLRGGKLVARVSCAAGCQVRATLRVTASTARRLGLGKRRTLATGSGSRKSGGDLRVRLRVAKAARSRLTRVRSYGTTLQVTAKLTSGTEASIGKVVRVRR